MIHWRRYFSELVGTAALLCAVIGSGIMAEQLAGGNVALALLANTLATVFALYVLIETLGPISGAHFNPVVSMVLAFRKDLARHHLAGYVCAQLLGAALGAWLAHAMFDLEILQWSAKVRTGPAQWLATLARPIGLRRVRPLQIRQRRLGVCLPIHLQASHQPTYRHSRSLRLLADSLAYCFTYC